MRGVVRIAIQYRAFLALAVTLVVSLIYYLYKPKAPILESIGIGGFVAVVAQFILASFEHIPALKTKHVLFVGKRNSPFNRALLHGLRDILSKEAEFTYDECLLEERDSSTEARFANALDAAFNKRRYDAVIVRLCDVGHRTVNILTRLLAERALIVLVDVDINRDLLPRNLSSVPFYIGSDFGEGGRLVANFMTTCIHALKGEGKKPFSITLLGPLAVTPAVDRGRSLIWELECNLLGGNSVGIILSDFEPSHALQRLLSQAAAIRTEYGEGAYDCVVMFCGNDNICAHLGEHLKILSDSLRLEPNQVTLIGYDGLKDEVRDRYFLADRMQIAATVDTLPSEQGRLAAHTVIEGLSGRLPRHRSQRLVTPIFVPLS